MQRKLCLSALLVALVVPALVACGDDDGGGPTLMGDGSVKPLPPPPGGDGGSRDTGTPTPPPPPPGDGGMRDTGIPTPPPPPPPPPGDGGTTAMCMASTRTCLGGCMDDACIDRCFASDEPCLICVNGAILDCASRMGCDDEITTFETCLETNMCMDEACVSMHCQMQLDAVNTCIGALPMGACQMDVLSCF